MAKVGLSRRLFTSESVTEGHPDKICDQISDAILDAIYMQDPHGRVACETVVTTGLVFVVGEITTKAEIDIPAIVRETLREHRIYGCFVRPRRRSLLDHYVHRQAVGGHCQRCVASVGSPFGRGTL